MDTPVIYGNLDVMGGIKKECPSLGLGAWRGRLREGQPAAQALSR